MKRKKVENSNAVLMGTRMVDQVVSQVLGKNLADINFVPADETDEDSISGEYWIEFEGRVANETDDLEIIRGGVILEDRGKSPTRWFPKLVSLRERGTWTDLPFTFTRRGCHAVEIRLESISQTT